MHSKCATVSITEVVTSRTPVRRAAKAVAASNPGHLLWNSPGTTAGRRLPFLSQNRPLGLLDESRKTNADTVSNSQHEFHGRVAKPSVHQAQHGFRYAGFLRNGIIRQISLFPFLAQQSNDLRADGLVMANFGHISNLLIFWLDRYFAMVKYWA